MAIRRVAWFRSHSAASRSVGNARLDQDLRGGGKRTLVANQVRLRADDPLSLSRTQFDARRWQVTATARIDNLIGKKYVGSVIANEGNSRYFEPAAQRTSLLFVTGRYAF